MTHLQKLYQLFLYYKYFKFDIPSQRRIQLILTSENIKGYHFLEVYANIFTLIYYKTLVESERINVLKTLSVYNVILRCSLLEPRAQPYK